MLQRLGQRRIALLDLSRACLQLLKQARILDSDHGLVGKGLYKRDLLGGEWPCYVSCQSHRSDHDTVA